ncbi:MAG: M48 family metallopeptidase [Patescibacteria group bacterium]
MYSQITANKRKTWLLIFLVVALIIGISAIFGYAQGVDPAGAIIVGTMIASTHALISYFFADKIALASTGAKAIKKQDSPELWNLVENLCITSGQPIPAIYVIQDDSPNAFATGRDPEHASIAFTTGILRILDKQELQGVTAHELSHIKNYDIRVMTIVVVLVGAVMLLADIMLRTMVFGGKREDKNGAGLILALIGIALALLSPLFAQLIQLAVSRSREYLADASGALLTRYPEGLASALEKISQSDRPLKSASNATAHLFIANPFGNHAKRKNFVSSFLSTHPPVEDRIKKLRGMA